MTTNTERMTAIEAQLVSRALQDLAFRDRLIADPKAVLAEQGLAIPDGVKSRSCRRRRANTIWCCLLNLEGQHPCQMLSLKPYQVEYLEGVMMNPHSGNYGLIPNGKR